MVALYEPAAAASSSASVSMVAPADHVPSSPVMLDLLLDQLPPAGFERELTKMVHVQTSSATFVKLKGKVVEVVDAKTVLFGEVKS